jgi:hypothetical protein
MTALVLQRLADLDFRAEDISVPYLKPVFAIVGGLGQHRPDAFFEHPHLFQSVKVVEHDALIAANHDHLPRLAGIRPAYVDVTQNSSRIPERHEADVLAAVPQDFARHGAHPLRDASEQIVEDNNVVGGQIPEGVNVIADRTQIRPPRGNIVYFGRTLGKVLFYFANCRIVDERVAHHQRQALPLGEGGEFFGIGHFCGEGFLDQDMLPRLQTL